MKARAKLKAGCSKPKLDFERLWLFLEKKNAQILQLRQRQKVAVLLKDDMSPKRVYGSYTFNRDCIVV